MARASNVVRIDTQRRRKTAYSEVDDKFARIVMHCIEQELGGAEFFTREDLLQLSALQSVATITRYQHVCHAVHRLIAGRKLIELSRTELAVPGGVVAGRQGVENLKVNYVKTIDRLAGKFETFSVMDVVDEWTSDQHLTTNAKRVAVRHRLRHLLKRKRLKQDAMLNYSAVQNGR